MKKSTDDQCGQESVGLSAKISTSVAEDLQSGGKLYVVVVEVFKN